MADVSSARERLTLPARRLPDLKLSAVVTGAPEPLHPGGRVSPVVVVVHGAACVDCLAYLRNLAAEAGEIEEWDGRVRVVIPESADSASGLRESLPPSFRLLSDPERGLAERLGIVGAAVVIADQYGEIHEAKDAGPGHDLPSPAEVVQWARYLAVQCPECQGEAL